jgi:hypothetical protein
LLSKRNYIDRIISCLPMDEEIKRVSLVLKEYVEERLKEGL